MIKLIVIEKLMCQEVVSKSETLIHSLFLFLLNLRIMVYGLHQWTP